MGCSVREETRRLVFALLVFLALIGETEVENWKERERATPVEVQEADLQTMELIGVIDETADLRPDDDFRLIVDPSELYARNFCCDIHDPNLSSRDAVVDPVR